MAEVCVRVDGLSKRYLIGQKLDPYGRLTESLWETIRSPLKRMRESGTDRSFWALRDLSMEVHEGEVVGIIGRNGAGKTTLLKILSRITEPTEGVAELHGRLGSLLEVGTGFHPDLTGRENIYLNGAILGMSKTDIRRRFDQIVEFSGVDKFLETPVKRYSTGMYVRLAFAVAAHLEPDVLVVDEVLSVGDAAFQKKCLGKMQDVAKEGRTVLFVSHNLAAVERLCHRALLLNEGRKVFEGSSHETVEKYLTEGNSNHHFWLGDRPRAGGDGKLRFSRLSAELICGRPGSIIIGFKALSALQNVSVSIGVFTLRGEAIAHLGNDFTGNHFNAVAEEGEFVCTFDKVPLLPGTYSLNIYCTVNGVVADWITGTGPLEVIEGDFFGSGKLPDLSHGSVALKHEWHFQSGSHQDA